MMSVVYQSEFDDAKTILLTTMHASGIPKLLWPSYVRLMAEETACQLVEEIHAEQLAKEIE